MCDNNNDATSSFHSKAKPFARTLQQQQLRQQQRRVRFIETVVESSSTKDDDDDESCCGTVPPPPPNLQRIQPQIIPLPSPLDYEDSLFIDDDCDDNKIVQKGTTVSKKMDNHVEDRYNDLNNTNDDENSIISRLWYRCEEIQVFRDEVRQIGSTLRALHAMDMERQQQQRLQQQQHSPNYGNTETAAPIVVVKKEPMLARNGSTRGIERKICSERYRRTWIGRNILLQTSTNNKCYQRDPERLAAIASKCTAWATELAITEARNDHTRAIMSSLDDEEDDTTTDDVVTMEMCIAPSSSRSSSSSSSSSCCCAPATIANDGIMSTTLSAPSAVLPSMKERSTTTTTTTTTATESTLTAAAALSSTQTTMRLLKRSRPRRQQHYTVIPGGGGVMLPLTYGSSSSSSSFHR